MFYHIKNLQSTKTNCSTNLVLESFITLRIYKVLKQMRLLRQHRQVLSH